MNRQITKQMTKQTDRPAAQEVDEHVAERLQIITAALLCPQ
jgi:hypothetical protein